MAKPHETLEKVGLLRSLERNDRESFEHRCQWRHAHPKEWLLEQNDIGTDIYFLTSGVVRVLITPSPDREVILGDIEAGGYFGEMAAIDGQPRSAGILAVTDATIARMPATVFREIIHKYPDVAEQLLLQLVSRIRTISGSTNSAPCTSRTGFTPSCCGARGPTRPISGAQSFRRRRSIPTLRHGSAPAGRWWRAS
jgi:CRP-like cAMP-binding protein